MSATSLLPASTVDLMDAQTDMGSPARTEIAFVLDNVADWQALATGLPLGVQVVVLDSTGDGLAQMAHHLASQAPGSVDAIHLLGHGSSGSFNLGALTLNASNLQQHTSTLAQIGTALTAEGDWLLYGCNVADGAAGLSLLGQLAQASGADMAASTNATGAAALGGDWVLEEASGEVQTDALADAGYGDVLLSTITTPFELTLSAAQQWYRPDPSSAGEFTTVDTQSETLLYNYAFVKLTPAVSGPYSVTVTSASLASSGRPESSPDTVIYLYGSDFAVATNVPSGTFIEGNDDVSGSGNFLSKFTTDANLTAGQDYYLVASSYWPGSTGTLSFNVQGAGSVTASGGTVVSVVDTTPPFFDVAPAVGTVYATGFNASASLNEPGTAYFVVVADGATAPSVEQVKAGQNNTGATALASNSAVTNHGGSDPYLGAFDVVFGTTTTLSSSTAYDVYFVATDTAGNNQASVTKVDVTTAAPINTRPVLDDTKSPTLGTIAANQRSPSGASAGVLVSSLIDAVTGGSSLNNYTDADNNPAGIAITGIGKGNILWYSTNAGTTWTEITGTLSPTSALTLKADDSTRVYIQPQRGYVGTHDEAIIIKAWDQTGGFTNGQTGVSTVPSVVSTLDTAHNAMGVAISGTHAYVADDASGLQIINISSPSNPTVVGSLNTTGSALGVALNGNTAYVADGDSGLQIINISTPATPTLAGTFNTSGTAFGVAVNGNYAYVADGDSGLQIINISTPATPTLEGSYNTPGSAYGVAVRGNYAYVADNLSGLQIIDVSNPANPTFVGTYNTPGAALGVAVSGNYAYVADSGGGLKRINVSIPSAPTLNTIQTTSGTAYGVAISGSYAYLADYMGVQVLDFNSNEKFISTYNFDSAFARGVAAEGDYAYVAGASTGLSVINLSANAFSGVRDRVSVSVVANSAPSATAASTTLTDSTAADTFNNFTGTLTFTDTENNSFTLSLTGGSTGGTDQIDSVTYDMKLAGKYGTLYFVSTGSNKGKYLYDPDDAAINALKATSLKETFTVKATDNGSPTATGQTTITVNLTGANDTPVLSAPTAIGIVDTAEADTQEGLIKGSSNNLGTLQASDVENSTLTYGINTGTTDGSTVVNGVTYDMSKAGTNGTLHVKSSTGSYVFVPTASAVNALTANTSEAFTVTVSDGSASGSQTLTVNYTAANDTPVITSSNPPTALFFADTSTSGETFANQTGTLAGSDIDTGQTKTFGITGGTTGSYAVTGIGAGSYDVQKVDAPYGTLYLNSTTGAYVFVPVSNAIDALTATDTINLSFDVTVGDGTASVSTALEVKISGKDDEPVVAKEVIKLLDTAAADSFEHQSGLVDAFDVDSGGADQKSALTYGMTDGMADTFLKGGITYNLSKQGSYGKLHLVTTGDDKGKYVYVPNATEINKLSANTTDSFTISASDGATTPGIGSNTFTVNITATNDAPVLTATTAISLTDTANTDSFSNHTGTLSASDAEGTVLSYTLKGATTGGNDPFNSMSYDLKLVGNYGTLYVKSSDGAYVYVPDATKINALAADAVDSFSVGASDGSLSDSHTLTVNLTGANDTPVLASITALSYTDTTAEDIFQTEGGQLGGGDADNSALLTYGISTGTTGGNTDIGGVTYDVSKAGTYGILYVASSSGAYLYVPDKAKMQSLKSGSDSDTFTVTVTDGVVGSPVEQTFTVNLTAADDSSSTGGDSTGNITEDDTSPVAGHFVIEDRDTADTAITA